MRKETTIKALVAILVSLIVAANTAVAQSQSVPDGGHRVAVGKVSQEEPALPPPPVRPGDFVFVASEMGFGGKVVKNAPYSAEAVTESTQTLSDGNRIVNKSTAMIYRDSEGRTRREQTLRALGPFANGGDPPQTIFISDPVAGVNYMVEPRSGKARVMPPMRVTVEMPPTGIERTALPPPPGVEKPEFVEAAPTPFRIQVEGDPPLGKGVPGAAVVMGWMDTRNNSARVEALGKQFIEGVEAEGKRTTMTIAAGEIGNERPIEIVTESWYSSELQIVVMTRHSDPRFGENIYRVTNINRSEPPRSLFEISEEQKIKGGQVFTAPVRVKRRPPQ